MSSFLLDLLEIFQEPLAAVLCLLSHPPFPVDWETNEYKRVKDNLTSNLPLGTQRLTEAKLFYLRQPPFTRIML
jgi:hypothetical protein